MSCDFVVHCFAKFVSFSLSKCYSILGNFYENSCMSILIPRADLAESLPYAPNMPYLPSADIQ